MQHVLNVGFTILTFIKIYRPYVIKYKRKDDYNIFVITIYRCILLPNFHL